VKGGWGPGAVWEGGGELCASSIGAWWGTRLELRKNDVFRISVDGEGVRELVIGDCGLIY